eukprot:10881256-Alexandrium_andersonii.AAC.1
MQVIRRLVTQRSVDGAVKQAAKTRPQLRACKRVCLEGMRAFRNTLPPEDRRLLLHALAGG